METLVRDVRYAARSLRRSPTFTLAVVVTLALGLGANAAIFSVVNQILLRSLPFAAPERLVAVWRGVAVSAGVYSQLRDQNRSFASVGAWTDAADVSMSGSGEPMRLSAASVTGSLFATLGVSASNGRTFLPRENEPGTNRVVLLSDGLWRQRFAADPRVIGQPIQIDGVTRTIIGVMPPGFRFPSPSIDLWLPVTLDPARINPYWGNNKLYTVARLQPGITVEQSRADVQAVVNRVRTMFPWPMPKTWGGDLQVVPLQESFVGTLRPTLLVLLSAVGLVLLIACVNVANLLLARVVLRRQEMAVRRALGAGADRLTRQLLTESLFLACLGSVGGVLIAGPAGRLLMNHLPVGVGIAANPGIDLRVVGFMLVVTLVAGFGLGLVPAFRVSRANLTAELRQGGQQAVRGGAWHPFADGLVVVEIALALVLSAGAGLLVKSLWQLQKIDPGFRSDRLVAIGVPLPSFARDTATLARAYYSSVLQSIAAAGGVRGVAATSSLPFDRRTTGRLTVPVAVEEHPTARGTIAPSVTSATVSPEFFQTMGIPLLRGRSFTRTDDISSPPVAVIDAEAARRLWPNEDALGKRFKYVYLDQWLTVVGVVGAVRRDSLNGSIQPGIYRPMLQEAARPMTIVVRSDLDLPALTPIVRAAVSAADRTVPIGSMDRVAALIADSTRRTRAFALALSVFAALALILGATGIYGVMQHRVTQRTREIGLRLAIGASSSQVMWMVGRQCAAVTAVGIGAGLLATVASSRVLARLLYGVSTTDAATLIGVSAVLGGVAAVAAYFPARRAASIDPLLAMRASET